MCSYLWLVIFKWFSKVVFLKWFSKVVFLKWFSYMPQGSCQFNHPLGGSFMFQNLFGGPFALVFLSYCKESSLFSYVREVDHDNLCSARMVFSYWLQEGSLRRPLLPYCTLLASRWCPLRFTIVLAKCASFLVKFALPCDVCGPSISLVTFLLGTFLLISFQGSHSMCLFSYLQYSPLWHFGFIVFIVGLQYSLPKYLGFVEDLSL